MRKMFSLSDGIQRYAEREKTALSQPQTRKKPPTEVEGPFYLIIVCFNCNQQLHFNKTSFLVDVTKAENMLVMESLILNVDYAVGTEVCCLNLI